MGKSTQQSCASPSRTRIESPLSSKEELVSKIKAIEGKNRTPASFTAGVVETPDGAFIPGISYTTDFRAEEEYGIPDLRKALTSEKMERFQMLTEARQNIAIFEDRNALLLSTRPLRETRPRWGDDIGVTYEAPTMSAHQAATGIYIPFQKIRTVADCRKTAKEMGIPKPWPTRKAELQELIKRSATQTRPNTLPGWFYYGKAMVLIGDDAENSVTAEMVTYLRNAAEKGTLGIGSGGGVFSSGFFLYDTDDETEALKKQREREIELYKKRIKDLEPVKKDIERDGWRPYSLGSPTEFRNEDGTTEVKYWLNGSTHNEKTGVYIREQQPFGWFTLQELKDRVFLPEEHR